MKITTKSLVITAMFAAIISVLSILAIPMPSGVPITLQTFAIALCGFVIGEKLGTGATALYALIGLIGVPVYAGMSAGPGVLFGATGGYIFGFILMAFFCGIGGKSTNRIFGIFFGLVGLACCHILGIIQLKFVLSMTWAGAALGGSVPYLIKDVLSVLGAYLVAIVIRQALFKARLLERNTANA